MPVAFPHEKLCEWAGISSHNYQIQNWNSNSTVIVFVVVYMSTICWTSHNTQRPSIAYPQRALAGARMEGIECVYVDVHACMYVL